MRSFYFYTVTQKQLACSSLDGSMRDASTRVPRWSSESIIYVYIYVFLKKKCSFYLRKMPERTAEDRTNTKWIHPHHRRVGFKLFKLKLGMKLGAQMRDSKTKKREREREGAFLISRRDFSCRMARSLLLVHLCEVFMELLSSVFRLPREQRQLRSEPLKTVYQSVLSSYL